MLGWASGWQDLRIAAVLGAVPGNHAWRARVILGPPRGV